MRELDEDAGSLRLVVEGLSHPRFHFEQGTLGFMPHPVRADSLPRLFGTDEIDQIDVGGPDIVILLRPSDAVEGVIDLDAIVNKCVDRGWAIDHAVVGLLEEE